MHILVVDPNEAFATLLTEELKRQGYDVLTCADGTDALDSARKKMPDLALLDMALEEPDALSLAKELRELDSAMRLMLIPLMGEEISEETARAVAVQGVLPKPFFLPELPERIEAVLKIDPSQTGASVAEPEPEPELEAEVEKEEASSEPAAAPEAEPDVELAPVIEVKPEDRSAQNAEEEGLSYDVFMENRSEVQHLMDNLSYEVGADAVLLTYGGGLLTWVGSLAQTEAESVARAIIHGWRTSAEVARILSCEQSRYEQSISGGDYMLYALSVEVNAIMAVVVRGSSPLGLLRHRARSTVQQIAKLCVQ